MKANRGIMPRRRNKKSDRTDPKLFTKRGERRAKLLTRIEAQANAKTREHRVLDKPWQKGGKWVDIDPVPPPFLRKDIRDQNYGPGSRESRNYDGHYDRVLTKPASGTVRRRRRVRNSIAKQSRKRNRS